MLNVLLLGLLNGAIYALVGAGLSLTYGRQNVIDVANPGFVIVGAYLVLFMAKGFGLDPFIVTPLAVAMLFAMGVVVQLVLINPLLRRPEFEAHVQSALVLFGLAMLLQVALVLSFSADTQGLHTSYTDKVLVFGQFRLPFVKLIAAGLAGVTLLSLHVFLTRSFPGKAILATYGNRQAAQLLAINVRRVDLVTYALGTAFAGIAGLVIALTFSFSPASVLSWTVIGFSVAVIGGKGSVLGILLAGLLVGLVEAAVSITISANWTYLAVYSLLLLVFVVRPRGLLGDRV
jgi:branched-chain amino acid transport system permease protein